MITADANGMAELEAFAALHTGHQIVPFSARLSGLNLDDAYRVAERANLVRGFWFK